MLHIIWGILKIILVLLGILAGLAVAVIVCLLFCPVRYRMTGTCKEGKVSGKAGIYWLFRVLWISIVYEEKSISYQVRIMGVNLKTYQKFASRWTKRKKHIPKEQEEDSLFQNGTVWAQEEKQSDQTLEVRSDIEMQEKRQTPSRFSIRRLLRNLQMFFVQVGRGIFRIIVWIWHIPSRMYQKIKKILLRVTALFGNIEKWNAFIKNERVRAALELAFGKGKRLLKHISPTKTEGWILFGFEDPSLTGQILAWAGMTCFLHKNTIELRPVFDKKILEADIKVRGRIRLFVVFKEGWELYFDKNVKYMMKAWKKEV